MYYMVLPNARSVLPCEVASLGDHSFHVAGDAHCHLGSYLR